MGETPGFDDRGSSGWRAQREFFNDFDFLAPEISNFRLPAGHLSWHLYQSNPKLSKDWNNIGDFPAL